LSRPFCIYVIYAPSTLPFTAAYNLKKQFNVPFIE
jgi:hypothetical protein